VKGVVAVVKVAAVAAVRVEEEVVVVEM